MIEHLLNSEQQSIFAAHQYGEIRSLRLRSVVMFHHLVDGVGQPLLHLLQFNIPAAENSRVRVRIPALFTVPLCTRMLQSSVETLEWISVRTCPVGFGSPVLHGTAGIFVRGLALHTS